MNGGQQERNLAGLRRRTGHWKCSDKRRYRTETHTASVSITASSHHWNKDCGIKKTQDNACKTRGLDAIHVLTEIAPDDGQRDKCCSHLHLCVSSVLSLFLCACRRCWRSLSPLRQEARKCFVCHYHNSASAVVFLFPLNAPFMASFSGISSTLVYLNLSTWGQ